MRLSITRLRISSSGLHYHHPCRNILTRVPLHHHQEHHQHRHQHHHQHQDCYPHDCHDDGHQQRLGWLASGRRCPYPPHPRPPTTSHRNQADSCSRLAGQAAYPPVWRACSGRLGILWQVSIAHDSIPQHWRSRYSLNSWQVCGKSAPMSADSPSAFACDWRWDSKWKMKRQRGLPGTQSPNEIALPIIAPIV